MEDFKLEDILIIIRRRILFFIAPVLVLAPLGLLTVMLLPAMYTTSGTILVESQQIPEELIQSTISTYAQERIQVIRQRVMTRERLLSVADKHDLFPDRLNLSSSEKVARMRQNLRVNLISVQRARGRQDGTIAFTVSYSHETPQKAYVVANEFMTLFLTEDVRTRKVGASDTTEFFDSEAKRIAANLGDLESRIADYKAQNARALPEHLSMHMRQLDRAVENLAAIEDQILLVDEERQAVETQLASYLAGAGAAEGPAQELARLKSSLAALRSEKTDAHPDVRALVNRVAILERQLRPSEKVLEMRDDISAKEAALDAARAEGDAEAIAAARAAVDEARMALSGRLLNEASSGSPDFLVAQLQGRLETLSARLSSLNAEVDEHRAKIGDLRDRIAATPSVERGLSVLTRDLEQLRMQYQQIQAKRQLAITAENLEDNQKAEKFSILEPAAMPDAPSSPDRAKLSVLAIFLSLAAGGGCALLAELLMGTVRGKDHLASLVGEPPIAVIPFIDAPAEKRRLPPALRRPLRRAAA